MSEQSPADRLNYVGDLSPVISGVCEAYEIGQATGFNMVEIGYEDCNVAIETEQGKYLAKMFAKTRTPEEIARYVTTVQKVVDAGVNHPELLRTTSGEVVHLESNISLVLMRFIDGKTFFEPDRAPDAQERKDVIEQASRVNRVDYKPDYIFDSWAIPNIQTMLDNVRQFVEPSDLVFAEQAVARFNAIPL